MKNLLRRILMGVDMDAAEEAEMIECARDLLRDYENNKEDTVAALAQFLAEEKLSQFHRQNQLRHS